MLFSTGVFYGSVAGGLRRIENFQRPIACHEPLWYDYPMRQKYITVMVTWFGSGLLPKAPGTWGSLAALPFIFFCPPSYAPFAMGVLFFIGWWGAALYKSPQKDPKEVVIDEVVGQWVALYGIALTPKTLILGFLLFRLFDILKPWPISWVDQLEGSKSFNALSLMLDDVLAGLMAWGVLWTFLN